MQITTFCSELGLILDFIGAFFIGLAFFLATFKDICVQSEGRWNSNPEVFKSLVDQKLRGVFGTVLLIKGFIFQFIGNIDNHFTVSQGMVISIIILAIIISVSLWLYLFKVLKVKYYKNYEIEYKISL